MASKELGPSLSPTFKVVDGQELHVDIYLPNENILIEKGNHPIGELLLALHLILTAKLQFRFFWLYIHSD